MSPELKRAKEAYEAKLRRDSQAEYDRLYALRKKHESLFDGIYAKIEQAAGKGKNDLFWRRPKNLKITLHDVRDVLQREGFDAAVNMAQPAIGSSLRISGWVCRA